MLKIGTVRIEAITKHPFKIIQAISLLKGFQEIKGVERRTTNRWLLPKTIYEFFAETSFRSNSIWRRMQKNIFIRWWVIQKRLTYMPRIIRQNA